MPSGARMGVKSPGQTVLEVIDTRLPCDAGMKQWFCAKLNWCSDLHEGFAHHSCGTALDFHQRFPTSSDLYNTFDRIPFLTP
jgi:hypothetical protein